MTKVEETPRRASLVNLDDDDRAVLGICDPQVEREPGEISHSELTSRYMKRCKLRFADAQNRASVTLAKLQPARPKTIAAWRPETVAFGAPLTPITTLAEPEQTDLAKLTTFFCKSGFDYETAQNLAVRQLSEGSSLGEPAEQVIERLVEEGVRSDSPEFNPDRGIYPDEPTRQQYLGAVAQITALLQPAGTSAYGEVIAKLGMSNLLGTLTAIANGFCQNWSLCQAFAARVVASRTVQGAVSYAQANAQAKRLVAELVSVRDKNPPPIGAGVVDPAAAARSAARSAPSPGPVTGTGIQVDQSAAMRAMQATDEISDSFYRAKAFKAARARSGR